MRLNRSFFLAVCLVFSSLCMPRSFAFSQKTENKSLADRYFENYEYAKAIPLYRRAAKKSDVELKKLADCYRLVKNYKEAEICYARLAANKSNDPLVYFYYAEALLNNNKYEEAKKQFAIYATLEPDDSRGDMYSGACEELKILLQKPSIYKVYNLGEVNSPVSDFSPVLFKYGLVFISERTEDLVNFSESKWTGKPFLSPVFAKAAVHKKAGKDSLSFGHVSLLSKKFYGKGHVGPICFNADESEMFFTRADAAARGKKKDQGLSKIYRSTKKEGWGDALLLPFNGDDYATGHPALSKDGQYLYFASSMPGSKGGTDIWVVKREGEGWGSPQNLGPEVNTKENESFPFISSDNKLYFSSSGHKGYGGLDLFSAELINLKWTNVRNMLPPINSSADDFGLLITEPNNGYFSSNREGGKGSDDLYGFMLSGSITDMAGRILLTNRSEEGAQNVRVFLLDNSGNVLQTTITDASGSFRFANLPADQSYSVKVDENDPNLVNQKKFYLTDPKNRIVRTVVKGKDGYFIFLNLPSDLSKLTPIAEEDPSFKPISIAGSFYAGEQRTPVENTKVYLLDEKGAVLQTTTTSALGAFAFMNIPPDKNFIVALDESDPKLGHQKIYFTNSSGSQVGVREKRPFRFEILASDKQTLTLLSVEDAKLLVDFTGMIVADKSGKSKMSNMPITLVDDKGNVVGTGRTDAQGNFKFTNLPADRNYTVKLKEDDPVISTKEIFLADPDGKVVATLRSSKGKFFKFYLLPSDDQKLAKIYFDDPWLKVAKLQADARKDSLITIIESVYYEYQKWDLGPQAVITLNKVIGVMKQNADITINIVSHTDARGSDDFNLKLSQKRAQAAVTYMVSKGIDKKRLAPIGKGETKPVNRCRNEVECTEDEHAQNRRTEFNIRSKASR